MCSSFRRKNVEPCDFKHTSDELIVGNILHWTGETVDIIYSYQYYHGVLIGEFVQIEQNCKQKPDNVKDKCK